MPQIQFLAETYASQIFWTLLTFGFVFFVIGLGMRNHAVKSGFGKARACVVGEFANDPGFTAIDDHVGDDLGQVRPPGNGEQMVLPLCLGDLDRSLAAAQLIVGRSGQDPSQIVQHARVLGL